MRNKTHQTRIYTLGNVISAALLKVRFFQACSKHFRKQRQSATTNGIQFPRIKIQSPSSVSRILHTSKHDHDLSRKKKKKKRGGKGEKREKKEEERERGLCSDASVRWLHTIPENLERTCAQCCSGTRRKRADDQCPRRRNAHIHAPVSIPSTACTPTIPPSPFVKFSRSIVPSQFSGRLSPI